MIPLVFIQAVPWDQRRVRNVKRMTERLAPLHPTVVWDQDFNAYRTYLRVLRAMAETSPTQGCIIMEDDVVLCDDWEQQIDQALSAYPDDVIQFWTTAPDDAELGTRWLPPEEFAANLCVYYPPGIPAAFLDWVGDSTSQFHEKYHDLLFGRFLKSRQQRHLQWVPSLVQHMPWESTVLPHRSKHRLSHSFRMAP